MTKQGAIKARMTSPDVCAADVNNFAVMETRGGGAGEGEGRREGGFETAEVLSYQRKCRTRVSAMGDRGLEPGAAEVVGVERPQGGGTSSPASIRF